MEIIKELITNVIATFTDMAPYLLLGLTFAGILHVLFKKEFILRHLGKSDLSASVKAALFGVPLPLCSCGVIPTALSLRKSHASDSATVSFLISTPQTGIDSIIATYGMLGPVFAVFRPLAALIMGIIGGIATGIFGGDTSQKHKDKKESFQCYSCNETKPHSHTFKEKFISMVKYAYGDFLDDISVQLIVGILISGIISFLIPPDFFSEYIGTGISSMLIMILVGIPLYICATASIPIAVTLMMKGLSPGAAFVFLAVGPATNAATITLIANAMGKRITVIYLSVISISAIISGYVLNYVYSILKIDPSFHIMRHDHEKTHVSAVIFSIVFFIMLLLSIYRKFKPSYFRKKTDANFSSSQDTHSSEIKTIQIKGMTCSHCAQHVKEAVEKVSGVKKVSVDLNGKKAEIKGSFSMEDVIKAVKDSGYSIVNT